MPATLRTCADCSTQYAVDLDACPHCGSSDSVDEGGAASKRLPLYVTLSCPGCARGPWTFRLPVVATGLIDLPTLACASCGSRVPVTWPPEEEPMSPKITVHGGATNAREAEVSPAAAASQSPQVVAEDDLGRTNPEPAPEVEAEDAAPVAEEQPEAAVDYEGMTLGELRELAASRNVPSYGNKAAVIERLREADQNAE